MLVSVNGQSLEVAEGTSVQTLVELKKLPQKTLICELNGQILPREKWNEIRLKPDDSVELIRIIGGG